MKLKSEQQDQSYIMTFDDLTNEINEQYTTFQRSTKKRAELSLLNAAANAASQSNNGGGNQSGKKNGNKGGRGGGREEEEHVVQTQRNKHATTVGELVM